jgi:hypothetical protein
VRFKDGVRKKTKKHILPANIVDGEPQTEDGKQLPEIYPKNGKDLYKVPGSPSPPGELSKGIKDTCRLR